MKFAKRLTNLIGKTPLLQLNQINPLIWVKVEAFNPLGSVKDRAVYYMLKDAIERGEVDKDTVIVESTSGNSGIALAYICGCMNLKLIITMPESMSAERRKLLQALGAEVVLTPAEKGMRGAIEEAKRICASQKSFMLNQFENPANVQAHKETTAVEILEDMSDEVDIFVAGVGTGGTISGCGEVLKKRIPNIKIIAVEPKESPVLSGGKAAAHKIQGIGAGFIPKILNREIIDEVITISEEEAVRATRQLAEKEGLLCGISSGAALAAALKVSARRENKDKKIAVVLPDTGERYLCADLFECEL